MYNLYLDDIRVPLDSYYYTFNEKYDYLDWVTVRSYDDFVSYINEHGLPELISFDHNLADEHYNSLLNEKDFDYGSYREKTGFECVKWLVDHCLNTGDKMPECLYHTQNIIGGVNMKSYVDNFLKYQ